MEHKKAKTGERKAIIHWRKKVSHAILEKRIRREDGVMKQSIMLGVVCLCFFALTGCQTEKQQEQEPIRQEQAASDGQIKWEEPTDRGSPSPKASVSLTPVPTKAVKRESTLFRYPTIYADIPDPDIIRVGESYYMVSTTMNLCPGVPVMKSTDLVHWEIVSYVYETLEDDAKANLENGEHLYARGSWAASIKYQESTGLFYVAFNSNDYGFYIYTTLDPEKGEWKKYTCSNGYHDPALLLEGEMLYVISASGDSCRIQQLSLEEETGKILTIGTAKQLFSKPKNWGLWEGAHAYRIGEFYYLFLIASPTSRWMRTELCYRSRELFSGEWEEKIVYQGSSGGVTAGLAQGGIVETQFGDWYAFLFQDRGAVGRVPSIVAVNWQEDWPLMGTYQADGTFVQNRAEAASRVYLPTGTSETHVTGSDGFFYEEGQTLQKVWQWNHNPREKFWSVTERPGYLRLTTDTAVDNIYEAPNSLTQRTYGPECVSETKILTEGMKPGEYAGLCAVADHYGMVGVLCNEAGERFIFQANGEFGTSFREPETIVPEPLFAGQEVSLKAVYDFVSNRVDFFYRLDEGAWQSIGSGRTLGFSTSTTFMGTRSWLFHYATKETGGYVDFDYYLIYDSEENREKEQWSVMTEEERSSYIKTHIMETECPAKTGMKTAGTGYGTVTHITYASKTTGLERGACILMPENYQEEKKYPVLYFLHGIFGDEYGLIQDENNRLAEILGNLVAEGKTRETIVVFPNMYATSDPDQKPGFQAEAVLPYDNFINDLVNDLIPYIESHYAAATGRENRGILGFSMGGRETIFIGISRPELFGYIGAIAPAPGILPTKDAFMTHEGQLKTEEELSISEAAKAPELFLICCGTKDSVVGSYPKGYHEILERNGTSHLWYEVPNADHDQKAIRSGFYNFLLRWNKEK